MYDVEQDNKGRIWIATDRGVARFDGYEFQTFDKKDGLPTNTILNMFKDSQGRLWFCGYDGSLTKWEDGTFKNYELFQEEIWSNRKSYKKWIESIYEIDSSNYVYQFSISSRKTKLVNKQLNFIDFSFSDFKLRNPKTIYHSTGKVSQFLRKDDRIIDTENEVLWNNSFTNDSIEYVFYKDKFSKVVLRDDKNYMPNYESPFSSTIYHVRNDTIVKEINITAQIEDILLHNRNIITGTWKGLISFDINNSYQKKEIITDRIVTGLLFDKESNLWLSTQNDGLIFIPNYTRIKQLPVHIKDERPGNIDVFENHLVVSYMNGSGLEIINPSLKKVFGIYEKSAVFYPGIDIKDDIAYTRNTSEIKFTNNKFQFNLKINKQNKTENPDRVCLKLKNGDCIRGTSNVGVYKDCLKNEKTEKLKFSKAPFSAIELPHNIALIGCVGGLYEINLEQLNYKRIDNEKGLKIGSRVNHIINYNDSLLIFSTLGDGLLFYNHYSREVISKMNIENDLCSNQVNVAFLENDTTLWAGTNFGLSKLNIVVQKNKVSIKTIENITTKEGLLSNFISSITKWNNKLWVATPSGTNYFKSDEKWDRIAPPVIFIDSTILINTKQRISSNTILEHDENDISFHYTGVTFRKPPKGNYYKYSLAKENDNPNWLETNNRSIQFTNLENGEYTFLVNAKNHFNQWATTPAKFTFCIKKHFSETIWFRLLCFILTGIIALILIRNKQTALLKKEKQIQKLKEAELNTKAAQLNALRNQMNPHFIYNSLNSIQNFIFKNDAEKANYMLSRFGKLMRSSLELSKLEYISLNKEIDFLENYLQLEIMRFGDKFKYSITRDPAIRDNYKIPPLLIQPIIENAIKHGFSEMKTDGIIKIDFKLKNKLIKVEVTDNGKGYSQNDDRSIYSETPTALKIINERIDLLNEVNDEISSFRIYPLGEISAIVGSQVIIEIPYITQV